MLGGTRESSINSSCEQIGLRILSCKENMPFAVEYTPVLKASFSTVQDHSFEMDQALDDEDDMPDAIFLIDVDGGTDANDCFMMTSGESASNNADRLGDLPQRITSHRTLSEDHNQHLHDLIMADGGVVVSLEKLCTYTQLWIDTHSHIDIYTLIQCLRNK